MAGWRRWAIVEPLSEGATLGLGGLMVMLALAIPAFRETSDEDWLKKSELAVTFLDRFGNEIGSRAFWPKCKIVFLCYSSPTIPPLAPCGNSGTSIDVLSSLMGLTSSEPNENDWG